MGLFNSYMKEGPGVDKGEQTKNKFARFFELYLRKFSQIINVNLIFALACIPIVTFGPATCGMLKVLKNFSMEKHSYVWSDFWEGFRKNFKQSFIPGLVYLLLFGGLITGFIVYPNLVDQSKSYLLLYVLSFSFAFILTMMFFYTFLMIVSLDLPLNAIIKNSFILVFLEFKTNVITLIFFLLVICGTFALALWNFLFLLLYPIFSISLATYIYVFNCYPKIQKRIIDPYYEAKGEKNPEYSHLEIDESEIIMNEYNKNKK